MDALLARTTLAHSAALELQITVRRDRDMLSSDGGELIASLLRLRDRIATLTNPVLLEVAKSYDHRTTAAINVVTTKLSNSVDHDIQLTAEIARLARKLDRIRTAISRARVP